MELLTESCVIISAISISKQQAVIEAASRNQLFSEKPKRNCQQK
jgi:hypothetical protein